jgi:hypothetical protein
MLWTRHLTAWLGSNRHTELAERVAGRSRLLVWQRVAARLVTLDPAEARGYIRARAIAVIHEQTDRLIEQEGPRVATMRERIIAAASELLVESLVARTQERRAGGLTRLAA